MKSTASKGRILIVEDESLVAEDLNMSLDRLGYSVVGVADTAEAAMALAREQAPDLALLDIRIKGPIDGIGLAARLREESIGFVFLTAHADPATIERAQGTEPLGYVVKPFETRTLVPVLQTALRRNSSEQRLRRAERWLSTTLRSIGDGVIVTDRDQHITFLNPAAESITGWAADEAQGRPASDVLRLVRGKQHEPIPCPAARAIEGGATIHIERDTGLLRRNGTWIPIDDCAAPVRDDDGTILGAVVVCRDGTERKQLAERQREVDRQLHQAEKLQSIGVLAGGLAHDLNNILTAILGNITLCREESADPPLQSLQEIERNARAAGDLCRQILAGAGSGPLERHPVDVGALVEECVARERSVAPPGLRFKFRPTKTVVRVLGDHAQLGQVVSNLLRNSAEAIGDRSGAIAVVYEHVALREGDTQCTQTGLPPGDFVAIDVIDDGPGMDGDVVARVFEPFFTTKFTGRGLGLSSVRRIVQRHGGAITIDSEPGRGTAIRVLLPWAPRDRAADQASQDTRPPRSAAGERILVVDDDANVRRVARRLLESRGYQVVEADSGSQALDLLGSTADIAGIIMDVVMPGRSGTEVLTDLRHRHPSLPVLLVSGFSDSHQPSHDRHLGFLSKPFSLDDLDAALRRLLDTRQA